MIIFRKLNNGKYAKKINFTNFINTGVTQKRDHKRTVVILSLEQRDNNMGCILIGHHKTKHNAL